MIMMRRKKIRCLTFFIGILTVTIVAGCSRMRYAKEGDKLWPLVGTKYVLLTDCYIVRYVDQEDGLNRPMLSCNINKPGIGSPELPVEVKRESIGQFFRGVRVVGTLSKGSMIRIFGIKRLESFEDRIPIFEVERVAEDGKATDERYDVIRILDRMGFDAKLDESVARRVQ